MEQNRKLAREILINKLDNLINGENSIANQKKRIDDNRRRTNTAKKNKMNKLKEEWKQRRLLSEGKKSLAEENTSTE